MADPGVTDELRAAVAHLRLELARQETDASFDAAEERWGVCFCGSRERRFAHSSMFGDSSVAGMNEW